MKQMIDILSQLHRILQCKIALQAKNKLYFYPEYAVIPYEVEKLEGYDSKDIETSWYRVVFYTDASAKMDEKALELAALYIKSQFYGNSSLDGSIIKLLKGDYDFSDIAEVNKLLNAKEPLYLIALWDADIKNIEKELTEIINNSIDVRYMGSFQGNLIVLTAELDVFEACSEMQRNILTEIYLETIISIGGKLEQPQHLQQLYNNCMEAVQLRHTFGISSKLLDYRSLYIYRLIASLEPELKQDIADKIFNSSFREILNGEMELTIEELFKNNLNLTDTAARLYVHRNTLLYRIEKIYKLTGYDLRKFEDSMIFMLAWLIYKEKLNQ